MKKLVMVLALVAIIATGTAFAEHPSGLGIGVVGTYGFAGDFGSGMGFGLSLKIPGVPIFWGVNGSFGSDHFGIGITGDKYMIDSKISGPLGWYFGLGGYFSFYSWTFEGYGFDYSYTWMYGGVRVPVGISIQPIELLEIFIDVAPSLGIGYFSGWDYTIAGRKVESGSTIGFEFGIPLEIGLRLWF
ncbi:MAG: hypothetical protein LBI04_05880 [Treponema sp.]|jgi:hypothetical protein|nr:hypothetical protein [Treponema sp.]